MRYLSLRGRLTVVVVVVAIIGAALWAAIGVRRQFRETKAAVELHRLLEDQDASRLFEARLGHSVDYRPFAVAQETAPVEGRRWSTAGRIEAFAATLVVDGGHASAARGLATLLRGDAAAAIEWFKEAVYLEPAEAAYWCDLAAASLQRGLPTDLLQALDAAEKALELHPDFAEAVFNRALAMERLGLLGAALSAWAAIETSSPVPGWVNEAREHRIRVERHQTTLNVEVTPDGLLEADRDRLLSLSQDALDRTRHVLEDELVPLLGDTCSRGADDSCSELLHKIVAVARALASVSSDKQPAALADQLSRWGAEGIRASGRADGMVAYGGAMRTYLRDNVTESADMFRRLARGGEDAVVSVQPNAVLYLCLDQYYRADHTAARRCLAELEHTIRERGFIFILARIEWLRAQISMTEGDFARAFGEFDRAIALLERARDRNQAAAVASLRATLREQVGELDAAWRDRIDALTRAQLDFRRRHTLYGSAARSCLLQQLPRAALRFQESAVQNALTWGQSGALVEAYLNLAVIGQRLGKPEDALLNLKLARQHFADIADPRARSRFEGELFATEGEVVAAVSPERGLEILGQASSKLTSMQFNLLRVRVEHAIGLAAERLGLQQMAASAYRNGIEELERQREPLSATAQMQALDLAWDTYERLIAHRLRHEGPLDAFATAESARAQVLRRFLPPGFEVTVGLSDLPAILPAGTVLLYFSVLDGETVRWVISREGVGAERIPIRRQQLDHLVRRFRRALDGGFDTARMTSVSAPLRDVVLPRKLTASTIFVIPDGPLHELPFAALWNADTGRYLIEDAAIGVAPSLRLFLSASRAANQRFERLDSALVVRGRMGTMDGQEPLPILPNATEEIESIAALYDRSRVLDGASATTANFLAQAGEYPVVHFTGHAVADRAAPELSRLFLQPSQPGEAGWLLVRDLDRASLGQTALVVLAACETGAGRVLRGEGVVSLARPFLGKGAAAVVYSLWKVADEPSMRLLTTFHSGVRAGLEPVIAMQRAQQALIADSRTPGVRQTWPAFQYAGGVRGLRQD